MEEDGGSLSNWLVERVLEWKSDHPKRNPQNPLDKFLSVPLEPEKAEEDPYEDYHRTRRDMAELEKHAIRDIVEKLDHLEALRFPSEEAAAFRATLSIYLHWNART